MIGELVLIDDEPVEISFEEKLSKNITKHFSRERERQYPLALTETCRWLRFCCLPTFYERNSFEINLGRYLCSSGRVPIGK